MGRWNLKSKLKRHFNGSTDANDVAGSPEKKDATSATITVQEIAVRSESRNGSKTSSLVSPAPNKTPATGEAERSLVLSTSDSTSILGLWDLAYEKLREEDESSVEEYEEKLSRDLGTDLDSTLDTRSLGRQELMDMVLQRKMDVINSEAWKLRFGSTEVQVKDLVQPVLGIISRVNGYVSDALAPNPSASMAWAGVSLLLPLLTNPSEQAASLAKGLEHISSVIAQSRMWEELYVRRYEPGSSPETGTVEATLALESHVEYKRALATLYKDVLKFQMTSYCYYARHSAFRLGLDVVKWTDWTQLLEDVRERERVFNAIGETWRDKKFDEECVAAARRHQEATVCWKAMGSELTELRRAVVDAQKERKRADLLDWLCDMDISEMYNAGRDKSGEGTGAWLIEDNESFQAWENEPSSLLWLYGKAGSGKSILTSSIINHLRERHSSDPTTALAYFYFSFSDMKKQAVVSMLASLLKQLCSRRPTLPSVVESLLGYKERGERPDAKTLEHALTAAMSGFSAVYIVIDALDECPGPPLSRERSKLLGSLCRVAATSPASLHMLCTSRKESDINAVLSPFILAETTRGAINLNGKCAGLDRDIGLYIDSVLASPDFESWPDEVKAEARSSLIQRADGMFQYVALQFDALRNLSSMPLIRQALQDLPVGLDDTYDRILLSIDPNYQLQVANALKWLALSERVFRIEEFAQIFIIHPEPPALIWSEKLFDPRDTLKYLSCLVHTWNDSENRPPPEGWFQEYHQEYDYPTTVMRLRLAHFSIKEYLMSHRITQGPAARFGFREGDAHLHIARCCLAYHLQRDAIGVRVQQHEELEGDCYELERWTSSSGFWLGMYAAANWLVHLERVPRERWPSDVCDAAARALAARSSALLETLSWGRQAGGKFRPSWNHDTMWQLPLHFTAYFGFIQLTDMLISSHKYLTQEDLDHALAVATDSAVIDLLVDKGARSRAASVDIKTDDGGSQDEGAPQCPVSPVIEDEIDSADDAEMDHDIDGFQDSDDPLDLAAGVIDDNTDCFNLVFRRKYGAYYVRGSALQRACYCEDSEAVQLLLDGGANVNARGGDYATALQAACARYPPVDLGLVTLLLESGADVNAQGGYFGNALQASCYQGHEDVLATLLEAGADINAVGGRYRTALQAALSSTVQSTVVSMLLRNGADVNQRGGAYGHYSTPLQSALAARQNGAKLDQAIMLLDHGADVNAEGGQNGTALAVACSGSSWNAASVEPALLLLRRGASAHAQGGRFGSAWHAAAANRNRKWEDVLQRMLDGGVDIDNAEGQQYATALEAALTVHQSEAAATDRVRFLLDRGADVNVRGGQYGYPLQAACCGNDVSELHLYQCFVGVEFLLENCPDMDINAQGGLHGTALQAAAYWAQTRSIRALLEHGADVNLRRGQHRSALNAAIFRGFWDIVEILVEAGATPDCQLQPEPDEEFLARVREELKREGRGAVERYHLFWEKHKVN